jgi:hypothetical protein
LFVKVRKSLIGSTSLGGSCKNNIPIVSIVGKYTTSDNPEVVAQEIVAYFDFHHNFKNCQTASLINITGAYLSLRAKPRNSVRSSSRWVFPGSLTDLSAWVGFCTSSPQQGFKYQL